MSHLFNIYPIISVKLTLSSISRDSLLSSVNHSSMDENSVFAGLNIINECGAIFFNCQNCLFGTKVKTTFNAC